ncbi:hypothetical protein INS49_007725 [Diaporthe citri]|uniref:uncharacterized protein n=1 Tax=Diaporthe citri TaxID=83186 RepID=UPI001C7E9B0C|nr:uncharacterized protein INS49_007725 [Diaporthe citri]KAG6362633.1 hypothetical protein INS49_007725 [Diaporthe citri]
MAVVGHEMADSKESVTLNEVQTNFLALLVIRFEATSMNNHHTTWPTKAGPFIVARNRLKTPDKARMSFRVFVASSIKSKPDIDLLLSPPFGPRHSSFHVISEQGECLLHSPEPGSNSSLSRLIKRSAVLANIWPQRMPLWPGQRIAPFPSYTAGEPRQHGQLAECRTAMTLLTILCFLKSWEVHEVLITFGMGHVSMANFPVNLSSYFDAPNYLLASGKVTLQRRPERI